MINNTFLNVLNKYNRTTGICVQLSKRLVIGEYFRRIHKTLNLNVTLSSFMSHPCPHVNQWLDGAGCVHVNHWCKPVYCKYETYRHLFLQILYSRSFSAIYSKARWAPNWCLFLFLFFSVRVFGRLLIKKRYLNIYMSTTPYLTFLFGILTEDQTYSAHSCFKSRRFIPKPGQSVFSFVDQTHLQHILKVNTLTAAGRLNKRLSKRFTLRVKLFS